MLVQVFITMSPMRGYTSAYPNNMCNGSGTGRNGLVPFGAGRYDSNNQSSHITSSISKNKERENGCSECLGKYAMYLLENLMRTTFL